MAAPRIGVRQFDELAKCVQPVANYVSENWNRPTGCVPRSADGTVLPNDPASPFYQDVTRPGGDCIEAPRPGDTNT